MAKRSSQTKAQEPTPTTKTRQPKASTPPPTTTAALKSTRKTAAQAVRDFMQTNPHLRNRDIVKALAEQGIVIDDTIPAQIKSRDKKGRPAKSSSAETTTTSSTTPVKGSRKSKLPSADERAAAARYKAISQPTVFVHSPVHAQFAHDLLAVRTHSQAVKNLRILVARLERIITMMEVLKDDDWDVTLLAQPDGLLFSATHAQANTAPQVRSRLEKLAIQPNEIVLAEPQ